MAYCGAIGSVNVLAFMSTDLFDESQENPFLLQQQSPPPSPYQKPFEPLKRPTAAKLWSTSSSQATAELPLDDHRPAAYTYQAPASFPGAKSSPPKAPQQFAPQYSPGRTVSFASAPRGILKRQSSYNSDLGTPSMQNDQQLQQSLAADSAANEQELHKLLYSMSRFGLASDPVNPHGEAQTAASSKGLASVDEDEATEDDSEAPVTARRASRRRRSNKKAASRQDPMNMVRSRGSVSFATVKNLLRGGGPAGRTFIQRQPETHRKKSMGTISSRLKRKQKFVRPTILTDAYHRVSDMKLGTRPLPVCVKHVAFPDTWQGDASEREEADAGMPPPKGQLKRDSCVLLETLDKIGTRAACPVHLLDEEKPDYSRVRARVDSYNHVRSPKRALRRPSTWLAGGALDARVAYYNSH